jgi:iron-sulfur cluster assembly enzyme ISCU, mitochondrial
MLKPQGVILKLLSAPQLDEEGNIVDSCFKTFGCGSAIASSSVATEWAKGRSVDDVLTIKSSDIAKHLSLPPVKLHCSMLAEDAIEAAVSDLKAKRAAQTQALGMEGEKFAAAAAS